MEPKSPYTLNSLDHLRHFFTPREHQALTKHGWLALELECEQVQPLTEQHRHFVAVINGECEPKTTFEFLWLRYSQICKADRELSKMRADYDELRRRSVNFENGIFREVEKRKEITSALERENGTLKRLIASYELRLGIHASSEPTADRPDSEAWREQD